VAFGDGVKEEIRSAGHLGFETGAGKHVDEFLNSGERYFARICCGIRIVRESGGGGLFASRMNDPLSLIVFQRPATLARSTGVRRTNHHSHHPINVVACSSK